MAIAFSNQGGTPVAASVPPMVGTTSVQPALPATINNGNIVLIYVGCKYDTASVVTPAGWTLAGSVAGGGTGTGNDSGPTRTTVFYRVKDAAWAPATMPTITVTGGNSAFAQAFVYSNATGVWDVAASGGADSTTGTAWSVTTAANPGITAGDMCFVASTVPTDIGAGATFSSQVIAASGITLWSASTERSEPHTGQGNDSGGMVFDRSVTTGTSTAAPVITATAGGTTTNIMGTSLLVRLREMPAPAITQAAYRFYADGTETASTALAAQDTAPTIDVTSNAIAQVRVRMQMTNNSILPATDDWQLQYEKNASGTWTSVIAVGPETQTDAYTDTPTTGLDIYTGVSRGQTTLGEGTNLARASFFMSRTGTPTGDVTCTLYAHTGTFGSGGVPTGPPLTTSAPVSGTVLSSGSAASREFIFDKSYTLVNGTPYCLVLEYSLGFDASNFVSVHPTVTAGAAGNAFINTTAATSDYRYSVTTVTPGSTTVVAYDSVNLTAAAATTNRLGAGTGSFVAGEVSENGVATDLGWSGINYTEFLYSILLESANLANGDTLRFRVLRNDATTGITYTAVPTINVTKSAGSTPISGSESTAITVTDTSSLAITDTKTATDTAAISVSESSSIVKTGFAITNRGQIGSNGVVTARVLPAFTPTANSKLYVAAWTETGTLSITDSLGLTWTQKSFASTTGPREVRMWETSIGSSPASMTVTVNSSPAGEVAVAAFDVTGINPQLKQEVESISNVGATYQSGTLASAATNGNLSIVFLGINTDAFTTPPAPAGWNVLARMPSGGPTYEKVGVFYRTDFTGTSTSVASTGENLAWGMVLFEIEEAVASTPKVGSESTAITISETSAVFKTVSATDVTSIAVVDSPRVDTSSLNLTEDFQTGSWSGVFQATGASAVSGGRMVMTYSNSNQLASFVTYPRWYTLASGNSWTMEVAKWPTNATVQAWDDFAVIIGGWDQLSYVAGGIINDGVGQLTANGNNVKYITFTNNSGNLTTTLRDAAGTTIATRNHTGMPLGTTTAGIGVDTQYIVTTGTATDTFEVEGVFTGSPAVTTPVTGSESTAITITESSAVFKTMTATDTTAITVTEAAGAVFKQFSSTDTTAITIADVSGTMVKSTTSTDTAAVAVIDTSALFNQMVATDTASIAVTENSGLATFMPGQDSATVGVTEQTSFFNTVTATDTTAITISDVSAKQVNFTATESNSLSVADVSALLISAPVSASDSAAISVAETTALTKTMVATDTGAITVSEFQTTLVTLSATDSTAVSVTETAGNYVTQATSDQGSLAIAETSSGSITFTTTDSISISISDNGIVYQDTTIPGNENVIVSVTEQTDLVKTIPTTDTISLTISDSAVTFVTVSAVDGAAISTTESVLTQKPIVASDTTAISVSDVAANANTFASTDTVSISVADVATVPAVSLDRTDTAAISVADVSSTLVTQSRTDTTAVSVNDVASVSVAIVTSDTAAISVAETTSGANTVTATDVSAISVNDVSDSFRTLVASDAAAVSVDDQSAPQKAFASTDTASVAVSETTSFANTQVAVDTTAITVVESTGLASTMPGQDTTAVGVTDTSSVFVTVSVTDGAAVSVADASATTVSLSATDSTAISVVETAVNFLTKTAVDGAAITISDAPGVVSGIGAFSAVDSGSIAVAESRAVLVQVSANETNSLAVYEIVSGSNTVTATDTAAIGVADNSTPLTFLSRTDTAAISVADTALVSGANTLNATDTTAVSVADISNTFVSVATSDTLTVALTESTGQAGNQPGQDLLTIGLTEQASIGITVSAADQASINVSDSANPIIIVATKAASDTGVLMVSESATISISVVSADISSISVTESVSGSNTVSTSDTAALTVTESRAIFVSIAAVDAAGLSVSEATQFAYATVPVNATDAASLAVSETTTQFITLVAYDAAAIHINDKTPPASDEDGNNVFGHAADTVSLSVAESTTRFVTLTASDTLTIGVTEAGFLTFYKAGSDTAAIGVTETANVFAQEVYRTYVYVYRGNTWREGEVVQWRNGAWRPVQVLTYKNGGWVDNHRDA